MFDFHCNIEWDRLGNYAGQLQLRHFEHAFLAQQMGMLLVEGRDLVCRDPKIYVRRLKGWSKSTCGIGEAPTIFLTR